MQATRVEAALRAGSQPRAHRLPRAHAPPGPSVRLSPLNARSTASTSASPRPAQQLRPSSCRPLSAVEHAVRIHSASSADTRSTAARGALARTPLWPAIVRGGATPCRLRDHRGERRLPRAEVVLDVVGDVMRRGEVHCAAVEVACEKCAMRTRESANAEPPRGNAGDLGPRRRHLLVSSRRRRGTPAIALYARTGSGRDTKPRRPAPRSFARARGERAHALHGGARQADVALAASELALFGQRSTASACEGCIKAAASERRLSSPWRDGTLRFDSLDLPRATTSRIRLQAHDRGRVTWREWRA